MLCEAADPLHTLFHHPQRSEQDLQQFHDLCDHDMVRYEKRRQQLSPGIIPTGSYVQRLLASSPGAAYDKNLTCLIPERKLTELRRAHSFDRELLQLKLKTGRVCSAELCSLNRCGLHVRDSVITPEEARALAAHGQGVFDAEGSAAYDQGWGYRRVTFLRSAHNGSTDGHVLSLRVAERMRRIAAQIFGVALSRIGIAETLLALRRFDPVPAPVARAPPVAASHTTSSPPEAEASLAERGSRRYTLEAQASAHSDEPESQYHCDESLSPAFHFTSIVWLSSHGSDFQGGELAFLHNRSIAWMVVEPAAGRAAFFSSGWENIHGIKPLAAGSRWAFSVPFMVNDELEHNYLARESEDRRAVQSGEHVSRGTTFRDLCVRPADNHAFRVCRETWAANLTQGRES